MILVALPDITQSNCHEAMTIDAPENKPAT
jgi:hypothetical protein